MKRIVLILLSSLLLTACEKAPAIQTESRVVQTVPAATTQVTATTTITTTTTVTTTTTATQAEAVTVEPSMQCSTRIGNYYFLDISDGFEFCVPGPAGYDLLHVFHYTKDDTLKELDYVIIPNEDFDSSILIGKSYNITDSGHYIFSYTSGYLFEEASKLSRQENRDKAWELWSAEVKE